MSFATGFQEDPKQVGSGELFGDNNIVLTFATFEDNLIMGRFAKYDTGSLDNLDASATPVIAGVVLRNITGALEDASLIDADIQDKALAIRSGLVTVDVVSGDTPVKFGAVSAHNVAGVDEGKATTTVSGSTVLTGAEWIKEIATDVWLVRLV